MVTMREIGRLAKVSQPTVSLILNGKADKMRICEETRDKVLRIAKEHGYTPNLLARAMRTGDTGVIGILVSKEAMQQIADDNGDIRNTLALQVGFLLNNQRVILEAVSDADCDNLKMPQILLSGLVDTVVICQNFKTESATYRYVDKMHEYARCIIMVDDVINDIIPSVTIDDEQAGRDAAEYLWNLGHRSFGIISCAEHRVALCSRASAFEQRVAELSGGSAEVVTSFGGERWQLDCGAVAIKMLLEKVTRYPSAIFATNDFFAYGAELELLTRGIRIPEDISLIGVGEWFKAASAPIPITTISVDIPRKIEVVMQIWKQFVNEKTFSCSAVRLVGSLCERKSVKRF